VRIEGEPKKTEAKKRDTKPTLRTAIQSGLALAVLLVAALEARAGEQVTFTNGFAIVCHHHATVNGRVRLYLGADEGNYLERDPADIAQIEQVPDPVPDPAANPSAGPSRAKASAAAPARLSDEELNGIFADASHAHNIDVDLLASVVKAESNFDAHAVSHAGAQGLMQLMPSTASDLGVHDTFQPGENVRGGSAYLDFLLTRYHENLALALAAYNAGPAAVDRYHGIPPYRETRLYVARVIREFNRRVTARAAAAAEARSRSRGTK